jgi:signal transduction histidine kinase
MRESQEMRPPVARTPILPVSWQKSELRTVLIVIAVCTWFSFWTAAEKPGALATTLLTTNTIGLSQWTIATLVRLFFRGRLPAFALVLAIPVGFVVGSKIASLAGAPDIAALMLRHPEAMRQTIVSSLLIGIAVTAFFLYFSHSKGVREALERERRRAAEALQAETAARLALLQAQIEPHFLFNTLANIHSLIEQDPKTASRILEELNAYLRTSLRRTRQPTSTLGEEIELIERLLAIAAARLGRRLEFAVSVPQELRSLPLPPLLLQPLVENAIRHGIEPAVAGGSIRIDVRNEQDVLELAVRDTGIGLNENAPEGVGLANVRARLASLYGAAGKLALYANTPSGVIARLTIPAAQANAT